METTQPAGDPSPRPRPEPRSSRLSGAPLARQDLSGSARCCQKPGANQHDPEPGDRAGPDPHAPTAPPQPGTASDRPRIRVSSPGDLLAVVPHLLGFHPRNSFVVIGASGPHERFQLGFRYDLPDPPDPADAAQIADHAVAILTHRCATTVIGVGYGPGRLVTPVADAFSATVQAGSFRLHELLRVEDGRYWSYLCRNVACCPAEGTPFDYRSHPAAAAMTAAGIAAYTDREALARTLEPVAGDVAQAMDQALEDASERAERLIDQAQRRGRGNNLRLVIREGRRAVQDAIHTYRDGGRITDERRLAWLMVTLAALPVRDDAWARMQPEYHGAHMSLWADVVRRATSLWLPAPGSLLAFTAWQAGEGALANIALDRVLAADPDYSMALLLREVLAAGAPPSAARLPMTPKEVAQSYARAGRRKAARPSSRHQRRRPQPGDDGLGNSPR